MIRDLARKMVRYLARRCNLRQTVREIALKARSSAVEGAVRKVLWEQLPFLLHHIAHDQSFLAQWRAGEETFNFVNEHLAQVSAVGSTFEVLKVALTKAQLDPGTLVLEFGVFQGRTINAIADFVGPKHKVHGFDSFEGLPERWRDGFDKGAFATKLPEVRDNVELHAGWFDKTLPDFLKNHREPVSFLHVDCDLYSSTRTIFDLLGPQIRPGTVIVFDEFFNYPGWKDGEYKAFGEFAEANQVEFEYLTYNRFHEQLALQIRSIRGQRAAA